MSIFSFLCHHTTSITQTSTFGYLNPPSKASGIAVALFQGLSAMKYKSITSPESVLS